ncbi:MAG TPA: hypothetical protein VGM34_01760 [Chlamydiales bacterium]
MSIKATSYGSGGAPKSVSAATAAAVASAPSLGALEDVFYTQLEQRMNEIRASWTRQQVGWTLLAGVALHGVATLEGLCTQKLEEMGCFTRAENQGAFAPPGDFQSGSFPVCSYDPSPCSFVYQAPLVLTRNMFYTIQLMGTLSALTFSLSRFRDRCFSFTSSITQIWPKDDLNEGMFRTLGAIEKTKQFALLQESEASQTDTGALAGELRKRRRFFFTVSIFSRLTPIDLVRPDFDQRMNSLIKTLLVDESGMQQLRDIRRCRQILMQTKLSNLLIQVGGQTEATSNLIVEYYIARPLAVERESFEFNHPLFW